MTDPGRVWQATGSGMRCRESGREPIWSVFDEIPEAAEKEKCLSSEDLGYNDGGYNDH